MSFVDRVFSAVGRYALLIIVLWAGWALLSFSASIGLVVANMLIDSRSLQSALLWAVASLGASTVFLLLFCGLILPRLSFEDDEW